MHATGGTTPGLETNAAQFNISDEGTLVFVSGGIYPEGRRFATWVDRTGKEKRLDLPLRHYLCPRLSPDGRRLAVNVGGRNVFVMDLERGTTTRLTANIDGGLPVWTPDGRYVSYGLSAGSAWRIADLSRDVEPLTDSENWNLPSSWTPDGEVLAFVDMNPDTGFDIWLLNNNGGGEPNSLMQTPANEEYPEFSPDGRWLAYTTNETGQMEVYVQSFPETGEKYQISTDGGEEPMWSKNGKEVFYRKDGQVIAVSIETAPGFVAGRPRILFSGDYIESFPVRTYDISADGKRFLMIGQEPFPDTPITHLDVVLNWYEELERLVPSQ
jgi:serine/threonine-protein kinase